MVQFKAWFNTSVLLVFVVLDDITSFMALEVKVKKKRTQDRIVPLTIYKDQ